MPGFLPRRCWRAPIRRWRGGWRTGARRRVPLWRRCPMGSDRLAPGGRIGILGGGQLGRMLALAAARLGLRVHVYEPGADPCAAAVVERVGRASWDDAAALADFAAGVDVVTYEFENVDLAAVDVLAELKPVLPGRRALEVAQDRLAEKS